MADYSEFPTTPTAWQEQQIRDWETVTPLSTEDPEPPRRKPDRGALIPGLFFVVLAISLMAGVDLPGAAVRGRRVPLAGPDRRRGGAAGERTAQGPPPTQLNRRRGGKSPGSNRSPGSFA